jgi:hypothetical protein
MKSTFLSLLLVITLGWANRALSECSFCNTSTGECHDLPGTCADWEPVFSGGPAHTCKNCTIVATRNLANSSHLIRTPNGEAVLVSDGQRSKISSDEFENFVKSSKPRNKRTDKENVKWANDFTRLFNAPIQRVSDARLRARGQALGLPIEDESGRSGK